VFTTPVRELQLSSAHIADLQKFSTVRFLGKFVVKWLLIIPPILAYVASLPCETLMPAVWDEVASAGLYADNLHLAPDR